MKTRPPVKVHGGKFYLCDWVISHFPENYSQMIYIEPYCGAASTLMNKAVSVEEGINDLDLGIVNIMRAIRDHCGDFTSILKKTPYTKEVFEQALTQKDFKTNLDHAVNEFIVRRMSRGGLRQAFAWSARTRGGKPGDENAWDTIIESLPAISDRLKKVHIFNKPALDVIKVYNSADVLLYVDPPYLHTTRVSTKAYNFEMTDEEHIQLAEVLNNFKGKVVLSGYPSEIYNEAYKNWRCKKKSIVNHASQQKTKSLKDECLWLNY